MPAAKKKADGNLIVAAPLVAIKSENGTVTQLFRGDVIPEGTSQESIDHLRSLKFVEEADKAAEPDSETPESDDKK